MTDFRIDVVVDPGKAQKGLKTVEKSLDSVEKEAAQLRQAIVGALQARDAGVIGELKQLNANLTRSEGSARDLKQEISQVGSRVNTKPIDQIDTSLQRAESRASSLGSTLRRAFAVLGVSLGVRELVGFADQLTNLQNRLRI
ncbi:MAG TPA: hypothetical protein VFG22_16915, partial [Polyangiales bacterium]|nr:hypothetical protein [Polyangiales bacterium]